MRRARSAPEADERAAGPITGAAADIDALLAENRGALGGEDGVYRFYHRSCKVFDRLQPRTKQGFELITEIGGEQDPPCESYCQIAREGTEHDFNEKTNNEWLTQTRPILEAFWHTLAMDFEFKALWRFGRQLQKMHVAPLFFNIDRRSIHCAERKGLVVVNRDEPSLDPLPDSAATETGNDSAIHTPTLHSADRKISAIPERKRAPPVGAQRCSARVD